MPDSRERMLARIRSSLQTNDELLARHADAYPPPHPPGPFVATQLGPVEQFQEALTALHGRVHLCDGADAAVAQVLALLETAGVREVLAWSEDSVPLPTLLPQLQKAGIVVADHQVLGTERTDRLAELEPVRAGISGADAAIAESGTMLVVSGAGRGRLASLLPPLHIALLPVERIQRTLPEAFALLQSEFGAGLFRDHSNVTLITGPSRTGDIELSLTLGVHGPRDLHAIVIC
ncbi:MAG: lactate utilization protein [Chloroflexi bacterium]|nr:MAG: lactate utilization protein [Chloroflexota bacterium]